MVAGNTLLKFFFGQMLDQLREDGAARVHPSLFHPEDRQKEVNPALFQFKSFLLRPCVIMLIFNGLEWPPEILAGQQCVSPCKRSSYRDAASVACLPHSRCHPVRPTPSHWHRRDLSERDMRPKYAVPLQVVVH